MNVNFFLLCISVLFYVESFAQTKFESGYILKNDSVIVNCQILNKDWKNSPDRITYKIQENAESVTVSASDIKAFGIGAKKYISAVVKIDRTALAKNIFSTNSQPEWEERLLFLKVLSEGQANLFSYELTATVLFFFNVNGSPIQQLVYREYKDSDGKLKSNTLYLNQLNASLSCGKSYNSLNSIKYTHEKLVRYFDEYNQCMGKSEEPVSKEKVKRQAFNIKPTIGLMSSSLTIKNSLNGTKAEYDRAIHPRFGLEFDYTLPFNNQKWEIYFEPIFYQYKAEGSSNAGKTNITFSSGEFHLGLRHYFFLNKHTKLFLTLGAINNFIDHGEITFGGGLSDLELKTRFNFTIGAGFEFKKLSLGVRYYDRNILNSYTYWTSDFKTAGVFLGFKLLRQSR